MHQTPQNADLSNDRTYPAMVTLPKAQKPAKSNPSAIKVDSGVPMPVGRRRMSGKLAMLRETLAGMKAGDSFVWDGNKLPYDAANQLGITIKTYKLPEGGFRVWRIDHGND